MISFATLLLGLLMGPRSVELTIGGPVARVELLLDGASVAVLSSPPWAHDVDFGPRPEPHELVAVALDAEGKELARARQRINLPRSLAEAVLVIEPGKGGTERVARLTWQSVGGSPPTSVAISFDGKRLSVPDPHRIEIPAFVPERLHFLNAELDFPDNLTATAEVTFGGRYAGEAQTELTAVPVVLDGRKSLPAPEKMAGWFAARGEALRVAAIEEGPAEAVFVVDRKAHETIRHMDLREPVLSFGTVVRGEGRYRMALKKDQRIRFLWPVPESRLASGTLHYLFPHSEDFTGKDGGIPWLMGRVSSHSDPAVSPKLADAVSVAALSAAGRNRARAVVLVTSDESLDRSQISAADARHYLEKLRVPLYVWRTAAPSPPRPEVWGAGSDVSTVRGLEKAVDRLAKALSAQRIVWLEGTHLPQTIELSAAATGLALAK